MTQKLFQLPKILIFFYVLGIHTVCIPSVPSMHHSMAIKNPSSSQRRTLSPTITIRHPSTAMSTSVSGQSKAVSVSGTHTSPSPHLISTADRMAPRSLDGSIPPFARASSPLVVSSIQSMISPRTPMSVNSSLTSPSQTIHSSPQPSFRGITPGSPYQVIILFYKIIDLINLNHIL